MITIRIILTAAVLVITSIAMPADRVDAVDKDYRLKMWIAPLECTRNEVSDGVTTTIILTPEQCDDLLHPPPVKPQPGKPREPSPGAPDTGKFSDVWTNIGMVSILSIFGMSIIALVIHDRRLLKRGSLQKKLR